MQDAEMKKIIEVSFQPHHCVVEFLPTSQTKKIWLRLVNRCLWGLRVYVAANIGLDVWSAGACPKREPGQASGIGSCFEPRSVASRPPKCASL